MTRVLRALAYLLVAGVGVAALVWPPGLVPAMTPARTLIWAAPTIVGGLISMIGAARGRPDGEWAGVGWAAAGQAGCASVAWLGVAQGRTHLVAVAVLATAAFALLAVRAVDLRRRRDTLVAVERRLGE